MGTLRIGFAGLRHGHIFALYRRALKSEYVETVGVFEDSPEGIEAATQNNIKVTHSSLESLLNDVDIVAIGDYYAKRGEIAIASLNAGKHVISDKPLCTSLKELEEIKALSEEKGLTVGLMLDLRDNKNIITAQKLIDEGEIGEVNNIRFEGYHPLMYGSRPDWYFEEGKHGGVINDIAIHGIDLARRFTHSDVDEVIGARCWNFYADRCPDFLDSAQFMLKMKNGAGVIADVSYASPNSHGYLPISFWNFLISGENGVISFNAVNDGVSLYKSGEKTVRNAELISSEKDYFDALIEEITSQSNRSVTSEALRSSEQTLLIQNFADKGERKC